MSKYQGDPESGVFGQSSGKKDGDQREYTRTIGDRPKKYDPNEKINDPVIEAIKACCGNMLASDCINTEGFATDEATSCPHTGTIINPRSEDYRLPTIYMVDSIVDDDGYIHIAFTTEWSNYPTPAELYADENYYPDIFLRDYRNIAPYVDSSIYIARSTTPCPSASSSSWIVLLLETNNIGMTDYVFQPDDDRGWDSESHFIKLVKYNGKPLLTYYTSIANQNQFKVPVGGLFGGGPTNKAIMVAVPTSNTYESVRDWATSVVVRDISDCISAIDHPNDSYFISSTHDTKVINGKVYIALYKWRDYHHGVSIPDMNTSDYIHVVIYESIDLNGLYYTLFNNEVVSPDINRHDCSFLTNPWNFASTAGLSLFDYNDKVGLLYLAVSSISGMSEYVGYKLMFKTADDSLGSSWTITTIKTESGESATTGYIMRILQKISNVEFIDGNPAFCVQVCNIGAYYSQDLGPEFAEPMPTGYKLKDIGMYGRGNTDHIRDSAIYYVRALNSSGTVWPSLVANESGTIPSDYPYNFVGYVGDPIDTSASFQSRTRLKLFKHNDSPVISSGVIRVPYMHAGPSYHWFLYKFDSEWKYLDLYNIGSERPDYLTDFYEEHDYGFVDVYDCVKYDDVYGDVGLIVSNMVVIDWAGGAVEQSQNVLLYSNKFDLNSDDFVSRDIYYDL